MHRQVEQARYNSDEAHASNQKRGGETQVGSAISRYVAVSPALAWAGPAQSRKKRSANATTACARPRLAIATDGVRSVVFARRTAF